MSPEEINAIISVLSGPGSGLIVAVGAAWTMYKLVVDKVLPSYDAKFDKIMEEHKIDRDVFKEAVSKLGNRLEKVEDTVEDLIRKIK